MHKRFEKSANILMLIYELIILERGRRFIYVPFAWV